MNFQPFFALLYMEAAYQMSCASKRAMGEGAATRERFRDWLAEHAAAQVCMAVIMTGDNCVIIPVRN